MTYEYLSIFIFFSLNMDEMLGDYRYLCLKSEEDPAANPDFEFVFNGADEATLCLEINFDGGEQTYSKSLIVY